MCLVNNKMSWGYKEKQHRIEDWTCVIIIFLWSYAHTDTVTEVGRNLSYTMIFIAMCTYKLYKTYYSYYYDYDYDQTYLFFLILNLQAVSCRYVCDMLVLNVDNGEE